MENYRIIARVTVTHRYFPDGICGDLNLYPTPESKQLFIRRQMICKKTQPNEWVFLQTPCMDGSFADSDEVFSLLLEYTDPSFLQYTQTESPEMKKGIAKQIDLTLPARQEKEVVVAHTFETKKMYWKYLLFPRVETGKKRSIKLTELSGKLTFKANEEIVQGRKATAFRTKEPVVLSESYPYQLRLYEEKEHGEKLLSQWVPFPRISDQEKNDEIIIYLYY
ncbi:hypothetical protein LJC44_03495 [Parabacteroides sp. OttesenSCG-928-G06]|nr:hypothetical protein [Parabacteroides sp. OttesenSCG-928-K15]MDL2282166.1 hypothetical protein [Parabacteroides sp. OttesenSCG-928-G06]